MLRWPDVRQITAAYMKADGLKMGIDGNNGNNGRNGINGFDGLDGSYGEVVFGKRRGKLIAQMELLDDEEVLSGTSHGSVEPLVGVGLCHVGEVFGHVEIDVAPFTSLRLVSGDGIAIVCA